MPICPLDLIYSTYADWEVARGRKSFNLKSVVMAVQEEALMPLGIVEMVDKATMQGRRTAALVVSRRGSYE